MNPNLLELEGNHKSLENKEEAQLRRSERKKVPSLWYIEHLNEYKKTVGKKNSGVEDRSQDSSETSSPIHAHYLPFLAPPQVYIDMMQTPPINEIKSGFVAFVLKPNHRRPKGTELNRSKNLGNRPNFPKHAISKKKPQRKFHQTFSSNRQKALKAEKKGSPSFGQSKKTEGNNNILDMILSAAMKVKKDPTSKETHHHKPPHYDDSRAKPAGSHNRVSDGGFLMKANKKPGKLVLEHSSRGIVEVDFIEKPQPTLDYTKLFQSRLFESCLGVEKETMNAIIEENESKRLEAVAKEKLKELKESFKELRNGSMVYT